MERSTSDTPGTAGEPPPPTPLPRRGFLLASGAAFGSAWLALNYPALLAAADHARRAAGAAGTPRLDFLTAEERAEVEALTALIIPSDETPGAREAGAVYFVDRALSTFLADVAESFREGLADFGSRLRAAHPGATSLADLEPAERLAFARRVEETPFFRFAWQLTVLGVFSHPSRGGNRERLGWKLIGFQDRYDWQPPFGHYDRDAHRGGP